MKFSRQWLHAISGRVSKPKGICHMLLVAGHQNLRRDIVPEIIIGVSQIENDLDSLISGKI